MGKNFIAAAALPLALCFAGHAGAAPGDAVNGFSFEAGEGTGAQMWRVGAQHDWASRWFESGGWHLGGYWDFQFGQWYGDEKRTITDVGVTPVFRYQRTALSPFSPYVEAAIGFHLIAPVAIDEQRVFSTAFQFGDHIGVGARFGERGRFDLSLRLQHLSNGSISKPNDGINFAQLRFQYHLE